MGSQEILVLAAVLGAVIYLSVRSWKALNRKNCGGACKGCSIDFSKIDINRMKQQQ